MTNNIKLTRNERACINSAWRHVDKLCDTLAREGAHRFPALLREALKAAKADAPEAAPKLHFGRAMVMTAILEGISGPPALGTLARLTQWYLLGCALGAGIRQECERVDISSPLLTSKIESARDAYEAAADQFRAEFR